MTQQRRLPDVKCPHCPKMFHGPSGLAIHIQDKHQHKEFKITANEHGQFKCPQCPRTFKARTGLGSHLRTAHGVAGQSSTAIKAREKSGKKKERLEQHQVPASTLAAPAPTGSPLKCPDCDYVAVSPSALGIHRRAKHGVLGKFAKRDAESRERKKIGRPKGSRNKPTQLALLPQPERMTPTDATTSSNGHSSQADILLEQQLAFATGIAVGSLKEQCRTIAEVHGIPARQFTLRCAELLLREARG